MYAKDFKTIEAISVFTRALLMDSKVLEKNFRFITDQAKKFLLFTNHIEKPAVSAMLAFIEKREESVKKNALKAIENNSKYHGLMVRLLERFETENISGPQISVISEGDLSSENSGGQSWIAETNDHKSQRAYNKTHKDDSLLKKADMLVKKGKPHEAVTLLKDELHKRSDRPEYYKAIGDIYYKEGQSEQAMAYFSRFNSTSIEHQDIHLELSRVFLKNNKPVLAKKSLGMVLLIDSNTKTAEYARKKILEIEGIK
jgi:tetratricopeptide (TPR) repeat protein